jgi:hypothetical protein
MPWVYLDDHFDEHPKVLDAYELDPQAITLFVAGLAYCRRSDSGGHIAATKVRALLGYRHKAERALVIAGLWEGELEGGAIKVHDYEQWNRAGQSRSASARNAARVRWADR